MNYTGERFMPDIIMGSETVMEHFHRYVDISQLVHNKVVLDAACGEGYGTNILSQYASKCVGIDISEEAIDNAKNKYQSNKISFTCASIANLPFEDHSFDVVVSFETIEHVEEDIQILFLKEVKRVLKEDGLFIISTPNKEIYSDRDQYKNEYHIKEFYKDEFIKFIDTEFKFQKLYGQYIGETSTLIEEDISTQEIKLLIDEKNKLNNAKYFVVVASNLQLDRHEYLNSLYLYSDDSSNLKGYKAQLFYKQKMETFTESNSIEQRILPNNETVAIKVSLPSMCLIDELRFDPIDINAIIDLHSIIVTDSDGHERDVINQVTSNAEMKQNNKYVFINTDPQFYIPLLETMVISSITIKYNVIKYGITPKILYRYIHDECKNNFTKEDSRQDPLRMIYLDIGEGFNDQETLSFTLNEAGKSKIQINKRVQNLRIDMSNKYLVVKINKIKLVYENDSIIELDPLNIKNNATVCFNGNYIFLHDDSQLIVDNLDKNVIKYLEIDAEIINEDFEIKFIEDLCNYIGNNKENIETLSSYVIQKEDAIKELSLQINQKENAINELVQQINQKDNNITGLVDKINHLQVANDEKQKNIEELMKELEAKVDYIKAVENTKVWKLYTKYRKLVKKY